MSTFDLKNGDLYDACKLLGNVSLGMYNLPGKSPTAGPYDHWKTVNSYHKIQDGGSKARATIFYSKSYPKHWIIGFKGTDSVSDGVQDIKAIPRMSFKANRNKGSDMAYIHRGFSNLYASGKNGKLAKQIFNFVSVRIKNNEIEKLYLTGHSLGGALAQLTLYDLMISFNKKMPDTTCITFGAPVVGNDYFRDDFKSRHHDLRRSHKKDLQYINVANRSDAVPYLPTPPMFMPVATGFYWMKPSFIDTKSLKNHTMVEYIKSIHECMGK